MGPQKEFGPALAVLPWVLGMTDPENHAFSYVRGYHAEFGHSRSNSMSTSLLKILGPSAGPAFQGQ